MLYYLAHPVAADERFTFEQNKAHVLKVLSSIHNLGIDVICNWYADICFLNETDFETRERCLKRDCDLVGRLDGIILTGHKLSSGMVRELEVVEDYNRWNREDAWPIVNLVGVPTKDYGKHISYLQIPV